MSFRWALICGLPALPGNELPGAGGLRFAAAEEGEGGCKNDQEEKNFFHGRTENLIGIACLASLTKDSRGLATEETGFLKGQLLLDGGELQGSFFQRTVVLICEHNAEGAFGLVLNRDTGEELENIMSVEIPSQVASLPVFLGGPVQPSALSILHSAKNEVDGNVIGSVSLHHSLEDLIELGNGFTPGKKLRVFAGYAGWSPGQLEDEMERGSWLTHPASEELIFDMESEELWKRVLSLKGWKYRLMAEAPENPDVN